MIRRLPIADADDAAREGAPEWMVSYADMITIMMAFFVVMFALSGLKDSQHEEAVFNSLQLQFGRYPLSTRLAATRSATRARGGVDETGRFDDSASEGPAPTRPALRVPKMRPGEQIVVGANLTFPEGDAELTPADLDKVRQIVEEVGGKAQRLEVRGHTSGRPLPADAPYRDHWDLAYARARRVMEHLVDLGISARRIRLSVAAANEPLADTDPARVDENSRVQVSVLEETVTDFQENRAN